MPKINYDCDMTCEPCQKGKLTKGSFHMKNIVSTTRPLELSHIDLFGPTRISSVGGKKYSLVIVDDFSRFTCVTFLSYKGNSCEAFEVFCKHAQNEKGFTISFIRIDHGSEFEKLILKSFVMKMAFLITYLLLKLLGK